MSSTESETSEIDHSENTTHIDPDHLHPETWETTRSQRVRERNVNKVNLAVNEDDTPITFKEAMC